MTDRRQPWNLVALLCATATAGYLCRVNASTAAGGVTSLGSNLGGLVSPAPTPGLAARGGWEHALRVAAVLALTAALLWLGIEPATDEAAGVRG